MLTMRAAVLRISAYSTIHWNHAIQPTFNPAEMAFVMVMAPAIMGAAGLAPSAGRGVAAGIENAAVECASIVAAELPSLGGQYFAGAGISLTGARLVNSALAPLAADTLVGGSTSLGMLTRSLATTTPSIANGLAPNAENLVLFGQKRVGPCFGTTGRPAYLAGREIADVAADLRSGVLSSDMLPIQAFTYNGQLVSANTRSLAALSEAGMYPTNIQVIQPTQQLLLRLTETPLIPNAPLPGPFVPVTPSQSNLQILRVISIPGH